MAITQIQKENWDYRTVSLPRGVERLIGGDGTIGLFSGDGTPEHNHR